MGKSYFLERTQRERAALNEWASGGETIYSQSDFPQWVISKLAAGSRYSPDETIKDMIEWVKRYHSQGKKQFCTVDGKCYFQRSGYERIIRHVKERELMRPDDIKKWETEAFGGCGA